MRLSLLITNDSRDSTRAKDSWGKNCLVETAGEEVLLKRPGLVKTVDTPGTVAQGLFNWGDIAVEIVNDTLYLAVIDPYDPGGLNKSYLKFGWNFASDTSLAWNSGATYAIGDFCFYDQTSMTVEDISGLESRIWYKALGPGVNNKPSHRYYIGKIINEWSEFKYIYTSRTMSYTEDARMYSYTKDVSGADVDDPGGTAYYSNQLNATLREDTLMHYFVESTEVETVPGYLIRRVIQSSPVKYLLTYNLHKTAGDQTRVVTSGVLNQLTLSDTRVTVAAGVSVWQNRGQDKARSY